MSEAEDFANEITNGDVGRTMLAVNNLLNEGEFKKMGQGKIFRALAFYSLMIKRDIDTDTVQAIFNKAIEDWKEFAPSDAVVRDIHNRVKKRPKGNK